MKALLGTPLAITTIEPSSDTGAFMVGISATSWIGRNMSGYTRPAGATARRQNGPLRQDRLSQRIARAHGFQLSGREIQERVAAAIPAQCARTQDGTGSFIWSAGQAPELWDRFRSTDAGGVLDPQELPIEESIVLARRCLAEADDDIAVLLAMRDACGLKVLREAPRERCRNALELARGTAPP